MTQTSQAELAFQFKSPEFNGNGYSSHVQTIENTTYSRQQAIIAAQKQAAIDAATAAGNTNLAKFLNNFESRVYAQLSTQLINNLFGENPQNSGTLKLENNTINYVKTADQISLTVTDQNGNVTQVQIPVGSFGLQ
jgi:curli production assembly/transport component CsgF